MSSSTRKRGKKVAGGTQKAAHGKFVDLLSDQGAQATKAVQLPGRHACTCEARRHALVNNCVKCGRIVCIQEGSGPCLFCGNLVASNEEEAILQRGGKKSAELRCRLLGDTNAAAGAPLSMAAVGNALGEAIKQKDKLLNFDKDSERRTRVLDDQTDYYSFEQNPFIPQEEKEALRRTREELTRLGESFKRGRGGAQKINIDFLGRSVTEANVESNDEVSELRRKFEAMLQKATGAAAATRDAAAPPCAPNAPMQVQLVDGACEDLLPPVASEIIRTEKLLNSVWRPERCEAATMCQYDTGACLSVHQPFASMIVRGIKTAEARSWHTRLRGRLWIASTGKYCESDFALQIEHFYENRYEGKLPRPFPDQYQSGVLLGCVDVVDCLTQEEYDVQHPSGEVDSGAYVLVFDNACELSMPLPVQGARLPPGLAQDLFARLSAARYRRQDVGRWRRVNFLFDLCCLLWADGIGFQQFYWVFDGIRIAVFDSATTHK